MRKRAALYWCNGGHYHEGWQCPNSGYVLPDSEILRVVESVPDPTYDTLLEAGLSEEQLLYVLAVDEDDRIAISSVACSETAGDRCMCAVMARNRYVLGRFPSGILWGELAMPPPMARHLYVRDRRLGGGWQLVKNILDPNHGRLASETEAQRVATDEFVQEVRDALVAHSPKLELRTVLTNAEYPPLAIGDGIVNHMHAGDFIYSHCCPLIPEGHLQLDPFPL